MGLEMDATRADLVNGDAQIANADTLIEEARQAAEERQRARDDMEVQVTVLRMETRAL